MLCEGVEERSEAIVVVDWTKVRAVAGTVVDVWGVAGGMGSGGATRRVLAREREELLAGGIREPDGVEEPCEAKVLMELRAWGVGRRSDLGGCGCGALKRRTTDGGQKGGDGDWRSGVAGTEGPM